MGEHERDPEIPGPHDCGLPDPGMRATDPDSSSPGMVATDFGRFEHFVKRGQAAQEAADEITGIITAIPCHQCGRKFQPLKVIYVRDEDKDGRFASFPLCSVECFEAWQKASGGE